MRVTDTNSFIHKANIVHSLRYDYSKSVYTKSDQKIEIICKEHGSFWQKANSHLSNRGCPACGLISAKTKNSKSMEILSLFKRKHGDRFCYGEMDYKNVITKIKIKCKIHGVFMQTPKDHLIYIDCCPRCSKTGKLTTDVFKEIANKVHGGKYDYSKSIYTTSKEKVAISCPDHGLFYQASANHLNGQGCPRCAGCAKSSNAEFIEKASIIHSNFYDYSEVDYKNNWTKVKIKCPDHGHFMQSPSDHLRPNGCKLCGYKKSGWSRGTFELACMKNNGLGTLYLIRCFDSDESFFKIGITSQKMSHRFAPSHLPYKYEVLFQAVMLGANAWDKENEIHKKLKGVKYKPRIKFKGDGECFSEIYADILDFFKGFTNV